MNKVKIIGFDADDTLWENGAYFHDAELQLCSLLEEFANKENVAKELFCTEMKNMRLYGYGVMAYTLSQIETAVRISEGKAGAGIIGRILEIGKNILDHPVEVFSGVKDVLSELSTKYKLILITKGDLLDQQRKLNRSGLGGFFYRIEVVSEKQESNYKNLLMDLGISPDEFMMVGNSIKSDVLPVLSIGGLAVHVPRPEVWAHENAEKPENPYFEISSLTELPAILIADNMNTGIQHVFSV